MKKNQEGFSSFTRRDFIRCVGRLTGVVLASAVSERMIGIAKAALSPVVVSVHDGGATHWDHVSGYHWDSIDQDVVSDMVAAGVMTLTGESSLGSAWQRLIPYQAGEAVAIKVNFNNSWGCEANNNMDAYPETVNAVIEGLTLLGVPSDKIWITDPSRVIPSRFVNRIRIPGVRFYSALGCCAPECYLTDYVAASSNAATPMTYPAGDYIRPAQVFVDAAHLINIPLLKGHGGAGVTLGMKNHYGSVTFLGNDPNQARERMHSYLYEYVNPDPTKSLLADISNNPHIRGKTRLVVGDGLFGNPIDNYHPPERWTIFGNSDPNILFFGIDPVATDSVMCDYINEERQRIGLAAALRSYLQHAQSMGLGVHDQWDDFQSKKYAAINYLCVEGAVASFPPLVSTLPATSITSSGAVLNGSVQANSSTGADYFFKFGAAIDYEHETERRHVVEESEVSVTISSLQPNTEYHFRIEAINSHGEGYGQDLVFSTLSLDSVDPTPVAPETGGSGGGGGCFIETTRR